MNLKRVGTLPIVILAGALAFSSHADTSAPQVNEVQPNSAWREATTLEVVVLGSGFGVDSAVRFLVAGTDEPGGVDVNEVRLKNPRELVAVLGIDSSVTPGAYDIEVQDALGGKSRAKSAFVVKPYSWAGRFGCSGAESWRRRIPCRRGNVD